MTRASVAARPFVHQAMTAAATQRHPKDDGSERSLCVLKVHALFLIFGRATAGGPRLTATETERTSTQQRDLFASHMVLGTMRPATSLKCARVLQRRSSWVDLRRTSCCVARASLLSWRRHAWQIQIKTQKGCLLMLVTPRCWCTTPLHDATSPQRVGEPLDEQAVGKNKQTEKPEHT